MESGLAIRGSKCAAVLCETMGARAIMESVGGGRHTNPVLSGAGAGAPRRAGGRGPPPPSGRRRPPPGPRPPMGRAAGPAACGGARGGLPRSVTGWMMKSGKKMVSLRSDGAAWPFGTKPHWARIPTVRFFSGQNLIMNRGSEGRQRSTTKGTQSPVPRTPVHKVLAVSPGAHDGRDLADRWQQPTPAPIQKERENTCKKRSDSVDGCNECLDTNFLRGKSVRICDTQFLLTNFREKKLIALVSPGEPLPVFHRTVF